MVSFKLGAGRAWSAASPEAFVRYGLLEDARCGLTLRPFHDQNQASYRCGDAANQPRNCSRARPRRLNVQPSRQMR
jgi:hypothetical protein